MTTRRRAAPDAATAEQVSLGRLDHYLGFRLRRLQNQLSKQFAAATALHGLRSGLFTALAIIEANPGISQNRLAREVGLDKSLVVLILDDLEKRGWAERRRAAADRRRHELGLTDEGQRMLNQLFESLDETEKGVFDRLSPDEIEQLHQLLDRAYSLWDDGAK